MTYSLKSLAAVLLLMLGTADLTVAQNDEQKAKAILKDVAKTYRSMRSFRADFDYTMRRQGSERVDGRQSGTITVKGDRFRVDTETRIIYCDGKMVWVYLIDIPEVQLSKLSADGDQEFPTPSRMVEDYLSNHRFSFAGEGTENGRTVQYIELTPDADNKDREYFKVKLTIDKAGKQLVRSMIYQKSGQIFTYTIKNLKSNVGAKDDYFVFDKAKHQNVPVIRLD